MLFSQPAVGSQQKTETDVHFSKTDDGRMKGKISFYCGVLHVSRQAFNKYLKTKDTSWKYQSLADAMMDICNEDECNDTYGRIRMYQALQLKQSEGI